MIDSKNSIMFMNRERCHKKHTSLIKRIRKLLKVSSEPLTKGTIEIHVPYVAYFSLSR